jgi:quinol monooxygenase YgiN
VERTRPGGVIIILGTVRLPHDNIGKARAAMETMVLASRAEDGCIAYSYAEDLLEPGLVRVTEIWRDQAVLDAHFKTAHLAAWRAQWPALAISERRLFAYEAGDPRPI